MMNLKGILVPLEEDYETNERVLTIVEGIVGNIYDLIMSSYKDKPTAFFLVNYRYFSGMSEPADPDAKANHDALSILGYVPDLRKIVFNTGFGTFSFKKSKKPFPELTDDKLAGFFKQDGEWVESNRSMITKFSSLILEDDPPCIAYAKPIG